MWGFKSPRPHGLLVRDLPDGRVRRRSRSTRSALDRERRDGSDPWSARRSAPSGGQTTERRHNDNHNHNHHNDNDANSPNYDTTAPTDLSRGAAADPLRRSRTRSLGGGAPEFCDEFSCGCAESRVVDVVGEGAVDLCEGASKFDGGWGLVAGVEERGE